MFAPALFTFRCVLRADPWFDPRYSIPISGMLLGNAVSGVSLAASLLLTGLVERKTEVEALLALGARPAQAARTLFAEATRTGFMPTLNSMLVIGLVSIPGMMTGQILGGAPIWQAALYQMFIMYLIAATCFFAIFLTLSVIQARAFGRSGCLVASRVFFPRAKPAPSGGTRAGLGKFGADCTALLCGGGRTRSGGAAAGGIGDERYDRWQQRRRQQAQGQACQCTHGDRYMRSLCHTGLQTYAPQPSCRRGEVDGQRQQEAANRVSTMATERGAKIRCPRHHGHKRKQRVARVAALAAMILIMMPLPICQ